MIDLNCVWGLSQKIFPILDKKLISEVPYTNEEFQLFVVKTSELEIADDIYNTVYLDIDHILSSSVIPNLWQHFVNCDDNNCTGFDKFQISVKNLYRDYTRLVNMLEVLKTFKHKAGLKNESFRTRNDNSYFQNIFKSILLSQLPVNFNKIIDQYYQTIFKVFVNMKNEDESMIIDSLESVLVCDGCDIERENCRCSKLMKIFNNTTAYLNEMDILDRLAGHSIIDLIQQRITDFVQETCQGSTDVSHLEKLEKWLHNQVFKWLPNFFVDNGNQSLENLKYKFIDHLFETYAFTIINQFFNIIIEYPDSKPAIDDLKICLVKIDLRNYLASTVKKSLETRLLHPGVNTSDVLTGYVAAIKALRHLDSSGVLLDVITEPVKEYLRMRGDTVRCVVTALTEEGPTDLAEELARSESVKDEIKVQQDDMTNWETWMPDPVDANPSKVSRSSRPSDIISMVVDIYGSKELFVNEYRSLLAERLLLNLDFNIEKELRNLELLKLRFGETLLHSCEVMLKDISDSKRINSHIHSNVEYNENKMFEMTALIVSSQFWPPFKKETIEIPDDIKKQFECFAKSYEAYKGNRTLNWNTLNGKVDIEIEFANKKIDLSVTTVQATILWHFQTTGEWQLDNLSHVMKIPPSILRKKINFWQSQGIIKETTDSVFTLADESLDDTFDDISNSHDICEDDEIDSAMASAHDQREEEFQVFWSYIVGMLINLDSLPLERIHQMLKMFAAQDPGMEFSQQELKNFLQRKVKEQKLVFAAGVYYLPK